MKVAEETWNTPEDDSNLWLNAAAKFADEFEGWGGFGTAEDEQRTGYAGQ